jgi:hypothetical protein
MRIERYKNFLTLEECNSLNVWVDEGIKNKWLNVGMGALPNGNLLMRDVNGELIHLYNKRFTTRLTGNRFQYPQIVLDISNRIRKFCGIDFYGLIEGHGRDGVVVSCTFGEGDVYKHKDSPSEEGLATLRCNVMTRKPDGGGTLHIGEQPIDVEVGELHCYLASDFEHYVTEVQGETGRVLWMFGAHVPFEDWESGKIKFNNG